MSRERFKGFVDGRHFDSDFLFQRFAYHKARILNRRVEQHACGFSLPVLDRSGRFYVGPNGMFGLATIDGMKEGQTNTKPFRTIIVFGHCGGRTRPL